MSVSFKIIRDWLAKGFKRSSLLTNTFHFEEKFNSFHYECKMPAIQETKLETSNNYKFLPYPALQILRTQKDGLQGLVSDQKNSGGAWSSFSDETFYQEHFVHVLGTTKFEIDYASFDINDVETTKSYIIGDFFEYDVDSCYSEGSDVLTNDLENSIFEIPSSKSAVKAFYENLRNKINKQLN